MRARLLFSLVLVLVLLQAIELRGAEPTKKERKPTTITSDHLEVNRKLHWAVYSGDVVLQDRENDITILSDRLEFFFDEKMEEVKKAVAVGSVRVNSGTRRSTSERAEYLPAEQQVVLTGNPKVWQEDDLVSGSKITIFFNEDRAIAEGDGKTRVQAVIHPKKGGKDLKREQESR